MSDIVERLRETQDDWPACLVELEIEAAGEIERLREENAQLRAALKPFAALAKEHSDFKPDFHHVDGVSLGCLRAAAAAIREGEKNEKV